MMRHLSNTRRTLSKPISLRINIKILKSLMTLIWHYALAGLSRGMPFGDVTTFRAMFSEREEKAWVLGWFFSS